MRKSKTGLWLGISTVAAGLAFAPAVFAQDNSSSPNNTAPSASAPADSSAQPSGSSSTYDSAKEKMDNAATSVENGAKEAYGKTARVVHDTKVVAHVKSALTEDEATRHAEIKVSAHKGVVTLSGNVPSKGVAAHAQQVAINTEGVKRVKNELTYPDSDATAPAAGMANPSSGAPADPSAPAPNAANPSSGVPAENSAPPAPATR